MADDTDPGSVRKVVRTVTPLPRGRSDEEMNVIGLGLFAGLLVLLVPLLPFLLVVWLVVKLLEILRGR